MRINQPGIFIKLGLYATLSVCVTSTIAQNSFKMQAGYALPLHGDFISANTNIKYLPGSDFDETEHTVTTSEGVYSSFGSGFQFEIGYLRSLSSQFDVGLDFNYLAGRVIQGTTQTTSSLYPGIIRSVTVSRNTNSFQVAPMIRYKFKDKKFIPYVGMGPLASWGTFYTKNEDNLSLLYTEILESYDFQFGFKNVFGLIYKKDKISAYFEMGMVSLAINPQNLKTVNYKQNGTPVTGYYPSPKSENNPMSNLSFNFGVMFSFPSSIQCD